MKTMMLSLVIIFTAQLSHALAQFEIQPLSIQAQSQVIGVQAGPQAQKAIIFTGEQAQRLANQAGMQIDTSRQMVVMTGSEATSLVGSAIGSTYTAGRLVMVTSANFVTAASKMALNMVASGVGVVWLGISTAATMGKNIIYYTIKGLQVPFYLITGAGIFLVKSTQAAIFGTLRFICDIPNYFGLGLLSCD